MHKLLSIVVAITFAFVAAPGSAIAEQKSILITGASTGIGRNLAEALAAEGHVAHSARSGAHRLAFR